MTAERRDGRYHDDRMCRYCDSLAVLRPDGGPRHCVVMLILSNGQRCRTETMQPRWDVKRRSSADMKAHHIYRSQIFMCVYSVGILKGIFDFAAARIV